MSKRNRMPGLRHKGGIWQIEKRCKDCPGGWLRESTGAASRAEAEEILIRRLAEIKEEARRWADGIYTFEEAAMRYLEEIADKPSADTLAMHLEQVLPYIGQNPLEQVHDGALKAFVAHEIRRGLAPKSVNNALGVASAVLNRAARVWRGEDGKPWLRQAPPRLSRLPTRGRQAKPYPLTWAEQDRLTKTLPKHLADAVLFAVNTGCREQEVCQLRWEWERTIPDLKTSVFVLPEAFTKTSTERVVVLNAVAERVVASRRGVNKDFVFTYRDKPLGKLHSSAWNRAWKATGLPVEGGVLKGVHNCGTRSAGGCGAPVCRWRPARHC